MNFNNYNKPIRLIELFAGIGSQAKALQNIGANFEHWRVCEFDEHAIRSYNAVHGTNFVTSDITKLTASDLSIVDTEHFTYLLTYSFPCQDLSNAGKGRGMEKGSGTRSGLLWEVERLLNECDELPQVLLMENVPQVHGKKNIEHFEKWIAFLESKGYSNHWQDLNAKDYGIPQNRNRCFMVSILGDYTYYEFPEAIPLTLKLGDMLEADVDEKYYLSDKHLHKISQWNAQQKPLSRVLGNNSLSPTLDTRCDCLGVVVKEPSELQKEVCDKALENGMVKPYDIIDYTYSNARLEEMRDGKLKTKNSTDNQVANTITTNAENMGVCVPSDVKPRVIGGVGEKKSNGGSQWYQQDRIYDADKVAISVTTAFNPYYGSQSLRIRKLTPRECWRLMGFHTEDVIKAEKVCSNSQLYKQAGNSIVVNVLMAIFKELFTPKQTRSQWLDELLNN